MMFTRFLAVTTSSVIATTTHYSSFVLSSSNEKFGHHRKLDIDLADRQQEIRDQILQAEADGIDGLALALNYFHSPTFEGLSMLIKVPGADDALEMLVDAGSSTISFCPNEDIRTANEPFLMSNITACTEYGNRIGPIPNVTVTDFPHMCIGSYEYFYGNFYYGNVSIYDYIQLSESPDTAPPLYTMKDVNYVVMDLQQDMTCDNGFDGIFGVSFDFLNTGFYNPSGDASDVLEVVCSTELNGNMVDLGYCNSGSLYTGGYEEVVLESPILQALDAEGLEFPKIFGIYLDYDTATKNIQDDGNGNGIGNVRGIGILAAGPMATEISSLYSSNSAAAQTTYPFVQNAADRQYWDLKLQEIGIRFVNATDAVRVTYPEEFCAPGNCISDSGNPTITLPFDFEDLVNLPDDADYTLDITIKGNEEGKPVVLSFPKEFLLQVFINGNLIFTGESGSLALGLPTWAYYYHIYDTDKDTITFVDLRRGEENNEQTPAPAPDMNGGSMADGSAPQASSEPLVSAGTESPTTQNPSTPDDGSGASSYSWSQMKIASFVGWASALVVLL